jgi:hypothetical protein
MFKGKRLKSISVVVLLVIQLFVLNSQVIYAKKKEPPKSNPSGSVVISEDTVWNSSQSPYIINGSLTVEENVRLTIGKGVVVKIQPGQDIIIKGDVGIPGEKDDRVVFTSLNDNKFGGSGIKGTEDYWGTIYVGANSSFDASYVDFTYGNTIFDIQGFLNLFDAKITDAVNTAVQVDDNAVFCGIDVTIERCMVGINNDGEVYLTSSELAYCNGAAYGGISGVRPFAIEKVPLVYGQRMVLKEGSNFKKTGNYKLVSLGGRGADVVEENILNGYSGELKIGDEIYTEPGNVVGPVKESVQAIIDRCIRVPGCTFENCEQDCPRIITIILIDSIDVNGRKLVEIEGFARFFIEDVIDEGGHTQIIGRYVGSPIGAVSPGINISSLGTFYGVDIDINNCDKGINTEGYISMIGCDIYECLYGIYFSTMIQPDFTDSSFYNNKLYGVFNKISSDITLNLMYNYWNSESGPSVYDSGTDNWTGEGDRVSDGVDYSDWLSEKPLW